MEKILSINEKEIEDNKKLYIKKIKEEEEEKEILIISKMKKMKRENKSRFNCNRHFKRSLWLLIIPLFILLTSFILMVRIFIIK